jgi:tetratricopeptide (TPR) repeat protein
MNKKKNFLIKLLNTSFLKIVFCLILSTVSAFPEEELTLDEENPSPSVKIESNSQNKTVPTEKKAPVAAPQIETKNTFLNEMTVLFEKKEYAKMTPILWAKIDSLNRSEMLLLVKAHYYNKEYAESIRAGNLMVSKDEKDEEALTFIGLSHLRRKKDREAKEFFRKASEINPVYTPALDGLVEIYEKNNNFYELRLIYLDLIKKVGEKSEYLKRLCDIDTKDGVNDLAIEYCKKAVNSDPKIPENHVNLGLVYKNMGELEKAKNLLKQAANKFPKSDLAQLQYALLLEEQKNYIEAYKFFNLCNKANAYVERCWVGFTSTSYQLLKFADAHAGLKKACTFNRKHSIIGRKAAVQARNAKQAEWARKLETLSDICGN